MRRQVNMVTELHDQSVAHLNALLVMHMQRVGRGRSRNAHSGDISNSTMWWSLAMVCGAATVAVSTTALLLRPSAR